MNIWTCKLKQRWKVITLLLWFYTTVVTGTEISKQRQLELDHLLKHDCGSCHGLHLRGGLGPALTNENMEKHSLGSLTAIILNGLPETAMPPWSALLSIEEARYLASQLKLSGTD